MQVGLGAIPTSAYSIDDIPIDQELNRFELTDPFMPMMPQSIAPEH